MFSLIWPRAYLVPAVPDLHARQQVPISVPQRHQERVHAVVHQLAGALRVRNLETRKHGSHATILGCVADPAGRAARGGGGGGGRVGGEWEGEGGGRGLLGGDSGGEDGIMVIISYSPQPTTNTQNSITQSL